MKPLLLAALAVVLVLAVPAQAQQMPLGAADALGKSCDQAPAMPNMRNLCRDGKVTQVVGDDETKITRPVPGGIIRDPDQDPLNGEKPRYLKVTAELAERMVAVTAHYDPDLNSETTCTDHNWTTFKASFQPGSAWGQKGWPWRYLGYRTNDGRLNDLIYWPLYAGPLYGGNDSLVRSTGDLLAAHGDWEGLRNPACAKPGNPNGWYQSEFGPAQNIASTSAHVAIRQEGNTTLEATGLPSCYRGSNNPNDGDPAKYGITDGTNVVAGYQFRNWLETGYSCVTGSAIEAVQVYFGRFGNSPSNPTVTCNQPSPPLDCKWVPVEADMVFDWDGLTWCAESFGECNDNQANGHGFSMEWIGGHGIGHMLGFGHDIGGWPEGPAYGGYRYNIMSPSGQALRSDTPHGPDRIGIAEVEGMVEMYPCVPAECPDPLRP